MILEGGYAWDDLVAALDSTAGGSGRIDAHLPGRTQLVSGERGPAVYVDFGHSPDAFEKTLAAVRRVTPGKVLMLFGADGDRDATKRHDMGRTAVEGSDILVITDHHPRFEDPGVDPRDAARGRAARPARRRDPRVLAARARDRRGGRARRRRRCDPVGRPWPPGLPRHPRRPHAVFGARARAPRAARRPAGTSPSRTGPCPTRPRPDALACDTARTGGIRASGEDLPVRASTLGTP